MRARVNADVLTVFGLAMSVIAAFVVGSGHFVVAIAMLFASGLPDLFDGPVAKASGTASVRGAFLDSVADRVSDAFLYGGVAWYLASRHHGTMVLLPFAILAVTSLISYERAKAELLGISSGGGLMERAERFILLGVCFVAGAVSASAFVPALWVFFGLVCATAVGRFVRTWSEAQGPVRVVPAGSSRASRDVASADLPATPEANVGLAELSRRRMARWRARRADSRWRTWREAIAQREGGRRALRRPASDTSGSGRPGPTWRERRATRPRASWRSSRSHRVARFHERAERIPGRDPD